MRTSYEVRAGQRALALQNASTPLEALVEYLRASGCAADEITRMAADKVAWRGAVYRAVPLVSDDT
jgi:hypothetical protein